MISVTDAIEELLYTRGGPCVAHRHKIAELLLAQETKILELTGGEKKEEPEPLKPISTEPPRPVKCSTCDTTYENCDKVMRRYGRPCCDDCQEEVTHNQNEWERWKYAQKS